jgi:hypothetical protein
VGLVEKPYSVDGAKYTRDRKGLFQMKSEVTLTGEQAELCRSILCQEMIKVSRLLARGKDESGRNFSEKSKRGLISFCSRVQLTLIDFGMTSRELEVIVKTFRHVILAVSA